MTVIYSLSSSVYQVQKGHPLLPSKLGVDDGVHLWHPIAHYCFFLPFFLLLNIKSLIILLKLLFCLVFVFDCLVLLLCLSLVLPGPNNPLPGVGTGAMIIFYRVYDEIIICNF